MMAMCRIPGNYYDVSQIATSADGKYALVSGVTPDTYKYAVSDIRLDDNTVLSTYEGQSFSMSCVDSKGFVIEQIRPTIFGTIIHPMEKTAFFHCRMWWM